MWLPYLGTLGSGWQEGWHNPKASWNSQTQIGQMASFYRRRNWGCRGFPASSMGGFKWRINTQLFLWRGPTYWRRRLTVMYTRVRLGGKDTWRQRWRETQHGFLVRGREALSLWQQRSQLSFFCPFTCTRGSEVAIQAGCRGFVFLQQWTWRLL